MNVALDYDGVISANYQHYFQLASDLEKSGHNVFVITGAKAERATKIYVSLSMINFPLSQFINRPKGFHSSQKAIGEWKKKMILKHKIDLWFDNEIKIYEQAGVSFSGMTVAIVRI